MNMLNCALNFEQLIALAAEKGLTPGEVVEANFCYMMQICYRPEVLGLSDAKVRAFASVQPEEIADPVIFGADKFLAELHSWLVNIHEAMIDIGGTNMQRGLQNWAILETILAENDPDVREYLEERDGKYTGIVVH